jgi:glyoxylase-like metal-dependent hydrolase (beta-lactamase superfamily II)
MIELAPNIYYIKGENQSRFPYCACLYLKGSKLRVLIDAGMGARNLAPVKEMGIDLLILTHCHIDHRLTRKEIQDVPVWCHKKDAIFLRDREYFFTSMGWKRSGLDLSGLFDFAHGMFEMEIDHEMTDGERIDLGGLTLETIHTPGHTPGHLSFFISEHNLLFCGDIDLTPFGPFYGHDFANIDDFLSSIKKLKQINAQIAATGHAGPFTGDLSIKFRQYERVIHTRDQLLLDKLTQPKSLGHFQGKNLFYRAYPDFPDLIKWCEIVHIEKHLARLKSLGKVRQESDRWLTI